MTLEDVLEAHSLRKTIWRKRGDSISRETITVETPPDVVARTHVIAKGRSDESHD